MFYRNYSLIPKILLLLIITSCSLSYGKSIGGCEIGIEDKKVVTVKWPYTDQKLVLNNDYWITSTNILEQSIKDIIWVDIRSKKEKINTPIANVISLSLVELESASFLFDRHVVLIGTGFEQLLLDRSIADLQGIGFKHIFALYGGVRVWNKVSEQKINLINEISAQQFLLGGKAIPWKVITVGLTEKDIKTLPEKPVKQFDFANGSIKEITQIIADDQSVNDLFISLVIVTANEKAVYQLKQQLQAHNFSERIVWLQGGLHNYQDYIKQQQKIIANAGRVLSRPCGLAF